MVLPTQQVDVREDVLFECARDHGRTLGGCSRGYRGACTPAGRLYGDEMPARCPCGCCPDEMPAGSPRGRRADPEPDCTDSEREQKKSTTGHAPEIGLFQWRHVPRSG